jgi:hypothetical protein
VLGCLTFDIRPSVVTHPPKTYEGHNVRPRELNLRPTVVWVNIIQKRPTERVARVCVVMYMYWVL